MLTAAHNLTRTTAATRTFPRSASSSLQIIVAAATGADHQRQVIGTSFFAKGEKCPGLGILDLSSDRGPSRAVGEVAGTPDPQLALPTITGFENHGGRTHLGPGLAPLARVTTGVGNELRSEPLAARPTHPAAHLRSTVSARPETASADAGVGRHLCEP